MFQTPLRHGADITLCSLTKYVGGHSDLVGGSISGSAEIVRKVISWRSSIGTQLDPNSCWMLMRSLETLDVRTSRSNENARKVAEYLADASQGREDALSRLPRRGRSAQGCVRPPMLGARARPSPSTSWAARGRPSRCSTHLEVMKLAVSLGGTETLISHPASMTHSGVPRDHARGDRAHRCAHPHFGRHRARGRPDRRPRAGAGPDLRPTRAPSRMREK